MTTTTAPAKPAPAKPAAPQTATPPAAAAAAAKRAKATELVFDVAQVAAPTTATVKIVSNRKNLLDKAPVARTWIHASWDDRKPVNFKRPKVGTVTVEHGSDKELGPLPSEAAAKQVITLLRLAADELPKTEISKVGVGVRAVLAKRGAGWFVLYRAKTRTEHTKSGKSA